MPVAVQELVKSRRFTSGQNPSAEFLYFVDEAADEAEADTEVRSAAPSTYNSMPLLDVEIEPIDGSSMFMGTVRYGPTSQQTPPADSTSESFETGGQTVHISQSLSTIAAYTNEMSTPDHGGAINVTSNGIEGVDIVAPDYQFTKFKRFSGSDVDATFKGNLLALTGSVNDASFFGLAAGECLFVGANGTYDSDADEWSITFNFRGSPNKSGLQVGDITGISKKGWEYLWVQYEEVEDATATTIVRKPRFVFVEQVYEEKDFSLLDIGTS